MRSLESAEQFALRHWGHVQRTIECSNGCQVEERVSLLWEKEFEEVQPRILLVIYIHCNICTNAGRRKRERGKGKGKNGEGI